MLKSLQPGREYIYVRLIVALDKFYDLIEFQGSKTLVKTSVASKRSSRFTSSTCAMALGFSGTRESRVVGGIEKFGSTVLEHVYIIYYIHIYIYTNQNSETVDLTETTSCDSFSCCAKLLLS